MQEHINKIVLLFVTWLGFVLIYPTFQLSILSESDRRQMPPEEWRSLIARATVPGFDLMSGYQFRLSVETPNLTDRGRENAMNQVVDTLRRRLEGIGIIESSVRQMDNGIIQVTVPASADTTLIGQLLTYSGILNFRLFKDGTEVQKLRQRIDSALAAQGDSTSSMTPFSDLLASLTIRDDIADIVVEESKLAAVHALLADSTIQQSIESFNRANPPAVKFVWAADPVEQSGQLFYPLYFVNETADVVGNPLFDAQVSEATQMTEDYAPFAVRVLLNDEGREDLTNVSSGNIGKRLAIGLNEEILMTLEIQGRIPDGRAEIPGGNTIAEARILATTLRTGALALPIVKTESSAIPPTVEGGAQTVKTGLQAGGVALILVSLFLIVFYRITGAVGVLGILYYLLMTGAILRLWNTTGIIPLMSLSGIAGLMMGLLLVLGSHILLFERLREELAEDNAPKVAVANAFMHIKSALIWIHGMIMILAVTFVILGSSAILDGAIFCFSGAAASLVTIWLMTQTLLTTVTNEWNLTKLKV